MDEEGGQKPAASPTRKKFVIPLDEDEVPPPGAKPLFKCTRSLPTVETPPQPAPQTYAEYAISGPPGGAGATHPTGPEPLAGETPNQAPKPGAKSNSIIVSPRQVRGGMEKWGFGVCVGKTIIGMTFFLSSFLPSAMPAAYGSSWARD